jgi:hypothetical protein
VLELLPGTDHSRVLNRSVRESTLEGLPVVGLAHLIEPHGGTSLPPSALLILRVQVVDDSPPTPIHRDPVSFNKYLKSLCARYAYKLSV